VVDAAASVVFFAVAAFFAGGRTFFAGGRTFAGAAMGLKLSKGRRLVAMSIRTSAGQFGYLLGAVLGGILLETRGFAGVSDLSSRWQVSFICQAQWNLVFWLGRDYT
jgi:predicted MFS family arabinose efflux permease